MDSQLLLNFFYFCRKYSSHHLMNSGAFRQYFTDDSCLITPHTSLLLRHYSSL